MAHRLDPGLDVVAVVGLPFMLLGGLGWLATRHYWIGSAYISLRLVVLFILWMAAYGAYEDIERTGGCSLSATYAEDSRRAFDTCIASAERTIRGSAAIAAGTAIVSPTGLIAMTYISQQRRRVRSR